MQTTLVKVEIDAIGTVVPCQPSQLLQGLDTSLQNFTRCVLGGKRPILFTSYLSTLLAFHLRDDVLMEILIVVTRTFFLSITMLTDIHSPEVTTILWNKLLDVH
jgi:hypothetical protein